MGRLEEMIRENREQFDSMEPLDGHFERFSERLGYHMVKAETPVRRFYFLKVAAVILLMVTAGLTVYDLATGSLRNNLFQARQEGVMNSELREAISYYDSRTEARMKEISRLASNPAQAAQIKETALREISALDESTRELEKSLAENPGCERLQSAILQNQQMKEGIVNAIVSKLSRNE